jgi:hypothetical protein
MIVDIPEDLDKNDMNNLMFDIGALEKIGSALTQNRYSMDRNYITQLIERNTLSVYNNWQGLALLDTFTIVGNKILDAPYKKETQNKVYYGIYLYCLFLKFNLLKYNFEINDLDVDKRTQFQNFISTYYFNYISYNFLPTEIFEKLKSALEIEKEMNLLNEKISSIGQQIQEEQQSKTNKILGLVTIVTSLSSAKPVFDYLLLFQKNIGWGDFLFWSLVSLIVITLGSALSYYIFKRNFDHWLKKLSLKRNK